MNKEEILSKLEKMSVSEGCKRQVSNYRLIKDSVWWFNGDTRRDNKEINFTIKVILWN